MDVTENVSFTDYASIIWPPNCSKFAVNWKNDNDLTIFQHDVVGKFFDVVLFPLLILVIGPSLMPMSSLVLEL